MCDRPCTRALRSDPAVVYAEPNYVLGLAEDEGSVAAVGVNDPKTAGQYSLEVFAAAAGTG